MRAYYAEGVECLGHDRDRDGGGTGEQCRNQEHHEHTERDCFVRGRRATLAGNKPVLDAGLARFSFVGCIA